jgi:integrase
VGSDPEETDRAVDRRPRRCRAGARRLQRCQARPGRVQAAHIRFADAAARYVVAYRHKRDGTPRLKSSLAKEPTCLNVYLLPALGNAWIGDLDLPELNAVLRNLTLCDGTPASGGTKSAVAAVLRRMFAWAREQRIILVNPGLELRSGWGSSARRKVIPSIQQVLRLAAAIDHFKPGLGDVAIVLAFTGLRSEEAVAVPIGNVNLAEQSIYIVRTASESGGPRDIRDDLKTRAAERTVMIPDIAVPAVRRLADHGAPGRERSNGTASGAAAKPLPGWPPRRSPGVPRDIAGARIRRWCAAWWCTHHGAGKCVTSPASAHHDPQHRQPPDPAAHAQPSEDQCPHVPEGRPSPAGRVSPAANRTCARHRPRVITRSAHRAFRASPVLLIGRT